MNHLMINNERNPIRMNSNLCITLYGALTVVCVVAGIFASLSLGGQFGPVVKSVEEISKYGAFLIIDGVVAIVGAVLFVKGIKSRLPQREVQKHESKEVLEEPTEEENSSATHIGWTHINSKAQKSSIPPLKTEVLEKVLVGNYAQFIGKATKLELRQYIALGKNNSGSSEYLVRLVNGPRIVTESQLQQLQKNGKYSELV